MVSRSQGRVARAAGPTPRAPMAPPDPTLQEVARKSSLQPSVLSINDTIGKCEAAFMQILSCSKIPLCLNANNGKSD